MENKITILGSGNSGLTMAAFLAKHNHKITLWNRSANNINKLSIENNVKISGLINGKYKIENVTSNIVDAVKNAKLIFITTPADVHKEIINNIAKHIDDDAIIILSPGRTFGIIEAEKILKKYNKTNIVAESQTIIFTCRKLSENSVSLIELKNDVLISTKKQENLEIVLNKIPNCIKPFFKPAKSFIETSLGNVGMVLHCAPLLLNIGWIESPNTKFKYYYEGITPTIANLLQKIDNERLAVAKKLGIQIIPLTEWFKTSYNVEGKNIYECIKKTSAYDKIDAPDTINHRYIFEDITTGLVPLENMGNQLGVDMKVTKLIIDLANEVLNTDFRKEGRKINFEDIKKNG